jgi:hypothetical protein
MKRNISKHFGISLKFWWGNLKERENLQALGVEGGKILNRILMNAFGKRGMD